MARVLQVLIIVDVEGAPVADDVEQALPHERSHRVVLKLTDHDAPRVERRGANPQPVDWLRFGRAIETVVAKAQEAAEAAPNDALHVYVGGAGPLPVFIHLGYAISKFTGTQWVIVRSATGPWQALPLGGVPQPSALLVASPLPTRISHATGQVALYLDVAARPMNVEALRNAVELGGERLADAVERRPTSSITVTPENAPSLAAEVASDVAQLPALFPHRSSIGVFLAGPTIFAFATGRAINPTVIGAARLYNYAADAYEVVYDLPFVDQNRPPIPTDQASLDDRRRVRDVVLGAIEALKAEVDETDLVSLLPPAEGEKFLTRLAALTYRESDAHEFRISVAEGSFSLGDGLLEGLRNGEQALQERFAKLLLVHEVFHEYQNIRSTNYFEVGRAGVVLEAVDFAADVFALRVLLNGVFRRNHTPSIEDVRRITCEWLDAVLYGIQAFDALEHGPRIKRLADRRLRRYLTWHLQRVRGESVDTPADVQDLLGPSVTAEVAPVRARIDSRYDREVLSATASTEFFASVGARLIRHSKRPNFEPGEMVEAVRGYNVFAIQNAMRFVVEENRAILIPWRT